MPTLDPKSHFHSRCEDDDERYMARVAASSEEVAAVLDGFVFEHDDLSALLKIVIDGSARTLHNDINDGGERTDSVAFADELHAVADRLPMATRLLQYHMRLDKGQTDIAEREGWDAEIRQMLVGKLPGFAINGKERDVLVREVRAALKGVADEKGARAKMLRQELKAILRDTGKKKGTREACVLSTLPMPELVEWLRRLGPDITAQGFYGLPKKRRKKLERRHGLIRDMWLRLGREVNAGPVVKGGAS